MSTSDFLSLFRFSLSPVEIIVRGTAIYWFLFALFRFVMRRDVGSIAIADILLLVMIADASQNGMAGEYKSIADGCLLVATLAAWNYMLDWASYLFPPVRRFVEAKPLLLVRDGRMVRANMRREFITSEEIEEKLREEGVAHMSEVHRAYLESDGEISLLLREDVTKGGGSTGTKKDRELPNPSNPLDSTESEEEQQRMSQRGLQRGPRRAKPSKRRSPSGGTSSVT